MGGGEFVGLKFPITVQGVFSQTQTQFSWCLLQFQFNQPHQVRGGKKSFSFGGLSAGTLLLPF